MISHNELMAELLPLVKERVAAFHIRKLRNLQAMRLNAILRKKNPYLFQARGIWKPSEYVKEALLAMMSSGEETVFGEILEQIALTVADKCYGGKASKFAGIDLEFERDGILYLVAIKSSPSWGNSEMVKRLETNFEEAINSLNTNALTERHIVAINGCCFGRARKTRKRNFYKLCGEDLWELISGHSNLYKDLVDLIAAADTAQLSELDHVLALKTGILQDEMEERFCSSGEIDWKRVNHFVSAKRQPGQPIMAQLV